MTPNLSHLSRLASVLVVVTALSGCVPQTTDDDAATTATAETSTSSEIQREVDLRYVSPTASPCTAVWAVGTVLPSGYEWCADTDGTPVAGVRIGSCEVVVHQNEAYAVPGRVITPVMGPIASDRAFLTALTSCKRRPAPALGR